jgi:adenylylsulfate kinase
MPDMHHNTTCLNQDEKERYLKQRAKAIWLTGYSGSGKSTIALGLERLMASKGYFTRVLDGDIIRTGINNDLGYSTEERYENIRRIAEINKLFIQTGIITINAFISPTNEIRKLARKIIGDPYFIEIFVDASLEECIRRDPKGLYKKALEGKIKEFTGLDAPYDVPLHPELVIHTDQLTEEQAVDLAFHFLAPKLKYS